MKYPFKPNFKTKKTYKSKSKRFLSKKHLEHVTTFDCILFPYSWCARRPVQAHHLLKPVYSQRGMGMRASDKDVIPLCYGCHTQLHANGNELKFFQLISDNENLGKEKCRELWEGSPYYEK